MITTAARQSQDLEAMRDPVSPRTDLGRGDDGGYAQDADRVGLRSLPASAMSSLE